MTEMNITKTTTPTAITDYEVDTKSTDGVSETGETFYNNDNFTKWNGNYTDIAKIKIAINAYATWVLGKSWTSDVATTVIFDNIRGRGNDTLTSVLWNMLVMKKVNGDSYAEIIRNDSGRLINLKPLDPASIRIVYESGGTIVRYEQTSKKKGSKAVVEIPIEKMFHLSNDYVAVNGSSIKTSSILLSPQV